MIHPTLSRLGLGLAALTLASCASMAPPQDATAVVQNAQRAMGGVDLKSISFAGSGTGSTFGQAFVPGMAWPKINYSNVVRVADYANAAFREDAARTRAEVTGGGAVPLMGTGEQRTVALVREGVAWNLAGPVAQPSPMFADARIHDLWTTPHGVLQAALRNKATMVTRSEGGKTYAAVSFTEPGRFEATALINDQGLVEKVESRMPNAVLGDTDVLTVYSGYREFGGVKFPARIEQSMGGFPVLDLNVGTVRVNEPSGIVIPDAARNPVERVAIEKAAEGVWFVAGGSHNSVAIEMSDHLVLVESPLYDGRSGPVIDEVRKLAPGKPIRYVINSHHHFDHAGGLRTAVAEGITLITSAAAKPFFERVLANPNRINPDRLAKSGRRAEVIGFEGKHVLSDGKRTVEIHAMRDSVHAQSFNMVYLPQEKILIEADAYTPGAPNAPRPNPINDNNVNLVNNVDRLQLPVARILPLHGRMVAMSELNVAVGR